MQEPLSQLDLVIIRCLQDDPRASYAAIARLTHASESTVKRRVDALIERGVIRPTMVPDIYLLGFRTSALVGLNVELPQLETVAETIRALPEVTFVALTMGRYDLMFFVAESSLEDLTRFMLDKIAVIPGIRGTETLVTPKVLKVIGDWRVPLQRVDSASRQGADGEAE